jgi:hypothetical protein
MINNNYVTANSSRSGSLVLKLSREVLLRQPNIKATKHFIPTTIRVISHQARIDFAGDKSLLFLYAIQ